MARNEFVNALMKADYTSFNKAFGQTIVEKTRQVSRKFAETGLGIKLPKVAAK